jgi:hypothetical protein
MKTLIRKYLIYAVLSVGCLLGFLGSASETFQLFWIPKDESGLFPMGQIHKIEGKLRRRYVNDVLWFPSHEKDQIFLGDSLETGKDATADIEITQFAKGSMKISPESLVKVRVIMSKPAIVLARGEVELSGEETDSIFVTSGLKTERVKIRRGTKTNVRRTDDGDLEIKVSRTDAKNEQGQTDIGQSKDQWVNDKDGKVKEGQEWFPRPLKYPYPADQTVFLVMGAGKIVIFPKAECDMSCHLRIVEINGTEILTKDFKMGEPIFGVLPYSKETTGDYRWTLQDGTSVVSGAFFFRHYSASEMKTQMKLKRPMEVLTGL